MKKRDVLLRFMGLISGTTVLIAGLIWGVTAFSAPDNQVTLIPKHIYPNWEAKPEAVKSIERIDQVRDESPVERSIRLKKMNLGISDIHENRIYLKGETLTTDLYKPVKFMMKDHALRMNNDCALCHHKSPAQMPADPQAARAAETMSCEACHQGASAVMEANDRLSLNAAYHERCITCHEKIGGEKAAVYCTGCHRHNIPKHETLFEVKGDPEKVTPTQMTGLCLECHPKAGEEMIKSAHYNWSGPVSKWTVTQNETVMTGKEINAINNNCISPFGDWGHCTKCHAGYGIREESGGFSKDMKNIDCLICHAEEDTYGKAKNGMPDEDTDLVWAAGLVGATSRSSCGQCHFSAGGGNARKGTLYNALNHPENKLDVHMGGKFEMICADCHKSRQHRIPGRHSSVGVDEGIVECTDCHAPKPHAGNAMAKHIDRHTDHVACATCHIPTFAREQQMRYQWDWRDVGKKGDERVENDFGKPIYLPDEGTFKWETNFIPTYSWDNGYTKRYLIGDKIDDLSKPVLIGRNLGDKADPDSKIGPFKIFSGWQPADAKNKYLAIPKLTGEEGVWESKKWNHAIEIGMKEVGLPFSGEITFVQTELRFRPRHEVAPKEEALTCRQCHSEALADSKSSEKTCNRCHDQNHSEKIKGIQTKGKSRKTGYLAWKNLGYSRDPILAGGRFYGEGAKLK